MKNYIIVALLVIILALASLLYKQDKTMVPKKFPVQKEATADNKVEVPLLLFVFFSKTNCHDCMEVIQALNDLPPHFLVRGIVPRAELKDEKELRSITGAEFPLLAHSPFKKFVPWYTPSIVGVNPNSGDIIFSLPGVPNEKEYIANFLESLYEKLYPVFLEEKAGNQGSFRTD